MRLDRTQPYSESIGLPGVSYEQNGRRFDPGGREVVVTWGDDGEVASVERIEEAAAEVVPEDKPFRGMHWRALKAMVESFDHEWVDKEDAVRFLESGE